MADPSGAEGPSLRPALLENGNVVSVAGPSTAETVKSADGRFTSGGGRGNAGNRGVKQPHWKKSTDSLTSNKKSKRETGWAQGEEARGSQDGSWRRDSRPEQGPSSRGGRGRGTNANGGPRGGRGDSRGAGRGRGRGVRGGGVRRDPDLNALMGELNPPDEQSSLSAEAAEAELESHLKTNFDKLSLEAEGSDDSFQDASSDPDPVDNEANGIKKVDAVEGENISPDSPPSEMLVKLNEYKRMKADSEASTKKLNWLDGSQAVPKTPSRRFVRGDVPEEIAQKVASLPIAAKKEEFLKLVKDNQIVLLRGDTGSGKSTQLPVFLAEAGYGESGRICSTQPRRLAATSLARRVSAETGTPLGTLVGYAVRFEKVVKSTTIIKYVTDGMLLKELIKNPTLSNYSVVIVDEAHERSDHTDVCLALLNRLVKNKIREDLKVIVSSATLDVEKFQKFFAGAPLLEVQADSQLPTIVYSKSDPDHIQGAVDQVLQLLGVSKEGVKKAVSKPHGDILVFLCGEDEIFQTRGMLSVEIARCKKEQNIAVEVNILPCYGGMTLKDQERIFEPAAEGEIKVVLATNIAETSLTIDGMMYVVDGGHQKEDNYDHTSGIGVLAHKRISQDQAIQRAGRVGRTGPAGVGMAYRLYTEKTFKTEMAKNSTPEIQRSNIDGVILDLIAMNLDVVKLEFIDKPIIEKVCDALTHLQELGALDKSCVLTHTGKVMSYLPLEPPLAKALLMAYSLGCVKEMLVIVSMLSTKHINLFKKPKGEKARRVHEVKKTFAHEDGDLLAYLNLWEEWKASGFDKKWNEDCLNIPILLEAHDIHKQLGTILAEVVKFPQPFSSCGDDISKIGQALASGLFRKTAVRSPKQRAAYVTCGGSGVEGNEAQIHPSSFISRDFVPVDKSERLPRLVLYHQLFRTNRTCLSGLHAVDPKWVLKYCGRHESSAIKRIKDLLESCGLVD